MLSSWNVPLVFTMCAWSCFACRVETETVLFGFLRIFVIMCSVEQLILLFSS